MRKIMAWLLASLMLVGILALPAAAEESTEENNSNIEQLNDGGTGGSTGDTGGGTGGSTGDTGGGTGGSTGDTGGGTGGSTGDTGGGTGGSTGDTGGGTGGSTGDTGGGTGGGTGDTGGSTSDSSGNTGGSSTDGTGGNTGAGTGDTSGGDDSDSTSSCNHAWIYVEVPSTCTEYGAKGYYCSVCEAVTGEAIALAPHTYDHACDTSCNVCDATREITHKFSTQWSKNSTKHWHACTVCGAKDAEASHYPGPAATEEKAQYCLTCGLMMMPQKNHTHAYAKEYTSDETGHWYACSGCDEKMDFQMHTYDNLCDSDCNDCGYTTATTHSFVGNWKSDENGHWEVCVLCQEPGDVAAHSPGSEATDLNPQLCSVCGYELAPALDHTHAPGDAWEADEDSHWRICACGEKLEESLHIWDDGTEEKNVIRYRCQQCDQVKVEEVPQEETAGFPWGIVLAVLILIIVCAAVALVVILIKGRRKPRGRYRR